MRGFLRAGFTSLCSLSFLLAVFAGWCWARSYRVADFWWWDAGRRQWGAGGVAGSALVWVQTRDDGGVADSPRHSASPPIGGPHEYRLPFLKMKHDWTFAGICSWDGATSANPNSVREQALAVPYGYLLPLSLILPARWIFLRRGRRRRWREGERRRHNLCARCGYDLRATTGRCPECGTPANPREEPPIFPERTA